MKLAQDRELRAERDRARLNITTMEPASISLTEPTSPPSRARAAAAATTPGASSILTFWLSPERAEPTPDEALAILRDAASKSALTVAGNPLGRKIPRNAGTTLASSAPVAASIGRPREIPAFLSLADHRARGARPRSSTTSSVVVDVDVSSDAFVDSPRARRAFDDDVSASSDEDARDDVASSVRSRARDRRRPRDAMRVAGAIDARMATTSADARGVVIARRASRARPNETTETEERGRVRR